MIRTICDLKHVIRYAGKISVALRSAVVGIGFIQAHNSLSNFLISLFLARGVGLETLGRFSLYLTIGTSASAILSALILQPFVSIASQKAARQRFEFESAINFSILLFTIVFTIIFCVLISGSLFFDGPRQASMAVVMILGVTISDFTRRVEIFSGNVKSVFIFDVLRSVMLFALFFWINSHSSVGAAVYVYAYALMSILFSIALSYRRFRFKNFCFRYIRYFGVIRILVRSGRWLCAMAILQFFSSHALIIFSFVLLGAENSGIVRVAQTLVGLLNPIIQGLENILPKWFGQMISEHGVTIALDRYRRVGNVITLTLTFVVFAIFFFARDLLAIFGVFRNFSAELALCGFASAYLITLVYNVNLVRNRAFSDIRSPFAWSLAATALGILSVWPLLTFWGIIGLALLLNLVRLLPLIGLKLGTLKA